MCNFKNLKSISQIFIFLSCKFGYLGSRFFNGQNLDIYDNIRYTIGILVKCVFSQKLKKGASHGGKTNTP